ncbi:MAG: thioredoxin-like domain-containing protein [Bacteroidota bacterium]
MTSRFLLSILMTAFLWQVPCFAQYDPDTSLNYETFLGQCMEFSDAPREEVWVVNFWATWNNASLDMLPQLKTAKLRYVNKPVRFISVSVDKNRRVWESQLNYYQLPWENMFLPREADYTFLKRAFKHNSLPATFIVNPQGNIRRVRDMDEFYMLMDNQTRVLPNAPYGGFASNVVPPSTKPDAILTPSNPTPSNPNPAEPTPDAEGLLTQDGWVVHKVVKGETLYSLYRKYGIKVDVIKSRNGMKSNTIKVGQLVKIRPL